MNPQPDQLTESAARTEALRELARRLFWWLPPEEALAAPVRFLAQVMTLGTWDEVRLTLAIVGEEAFRRTLQEAPPGVFDLPAWLYWHRYFGIEPAPPLPRRQVP